MGTAQFCSVKWCFEGLICEQILQTCNIKVCFWFPSCSRHDHLNRSRVLVHLIYLVLDVTYTLYCINNHYMLGRRV